MGILAKVFKATIMTYAERCRFAAPSLERQAYLVFRDVDRARLRYQAKGIAKEEFYDLFQSTLAATQHWPSENDTLSPAYKKLTHNLATAGDESFFRTLLLLVEKDQKPAKAFILCHLHDLPRAVDSVAAILDARLGQKPKTSCNMKNKNPFFPK